MKAIKKQAKKAKNQLAQYGSIIFGVGLLIAIIASFITFEGTTQKVLVATLVLLGLVVGVLNVTGDETVTFLVASIAIILLTGPFLGTLAQNFVFFQKEWVPALFGNIITLMVPASIIVALKAIFVIAKDE